MPFVDSIKTVVREVEVSKASFEGVECRICLGKQGLGEQFRHDDLVASSCGDVSGLERDTLTPEV